MGSTRKTTTSDKAKAKRAAGRSRPADTRRQQSSRAQAPKAPGTRDSAPDSAPRVEPDVSPPQPAIAADLVVLRNVSGQAFTVNLTHEHYCKGAGECFCRWVSLRLNPQRVDGSVGFQEHKVRRNASLTILANAKSRPLHRAVLDVPGVQTAMRAPNPLLISMNGG